MRNREKLIIISERSPDITASEQGGMKKKKEKRKMKKSLERRKALTVPPNIQAHHL